MGAISRPAINQKFYGHAAHSLAFDCHPENLAMMTAQVKMRRYASGASRTGEH
jgi:hypothetical protein